MRVAIALPLVLSAGATPAGAAGPVAELLGYVPGRANVALLVDVDALNKSKIAEDNRWGSPDVAMTGLDSLPANITGWWWPASSAPAPGRPGRSRSSG